LDVPYLVQKELYNVSNPIMAQDGDDDVPSVGDLQTAPNETDTETDLDDCIPFETHYQEESPPDDPIAVPATPTRKDDKPPRGVGPKPVPTGLEQNLPPNSHSKKRQTIHDAAVEEVALDEPNGGHSSTGHDDTTPRRAGPKPARLEWTLPPNSHPSKRRKMDHTGPETSRHGRDTDDVRSPKAMKIRALDEEEQVTNAVLLRLADQLFRERVESLQSMDGLQVKHFIGLLEKRLQIPRLSDEKCVMIRRRLVELVNSPNEPEQSSIASPRKLTKRHSKHETHGVVSDETDTDDAARARVSRPHSAGAVGLVESHEGSWAQKFMELCEYKRKFGNCLVPHSCAEYTGLANWVTYQRREYKLQVEGKPGSTMTPERVAAMERIGFVWDAQELAWMERLQELKAFKDVRGHCNVPPSYRENKPLATWVKNQRRFFLRAAEKIPRSTSF
jgi:Helicase associated domain